MAPGLWHLGNVGEVCTIIDLLESGEAFVQVIGNFNALLLGQSELAGNCTLRQPFSISVFSHHDADADDASGEDYDYADDHNDDPERELVSLILFNIFFIRELLVTAFKFVDEELSRPEGTESI